MASLSKDQSKQRKDRPAVRKRFVGRAKVLQSDPKFRETLEEIRSAWNEDHPTFSLRAAEPAPSSLAANLIAVCLPPRLEGAIRVHKNRAEKVPRSLEQVAGRWVDVVLTGCELLWPPPIYHNWLGYPLHPATLFLSACLIWEPTSVDADELIIYGNLRPRPLGYDPFDHWNTPGAAYWRTFASVLAEAIEGAIAEGTILTEEWRNALKREATLAGFKAHNDKISVSPDDLHWVFSPFPGLTGTDRDDLMAAMLEAVTDRYGVDPIRGYALSLAEEGMNPNQIAKSLGVDQKTVVAWLKTA